MKQKANIMSKKWCFSVCLLAIAVFSESFSKLCFHPIAPFYSCSWIVYRFVWYAHGSLASNADVKIGAVGAVCSLIYIWRPRKRREHNMLNEIIFVCVSACMFVCIKRLLSLFDIQSQVKFIQYV